MAATLTLTLSLPALAAPAVTVRGVVRDPSGAAIAGARVVPRADGRPGVETITDAEGRYTVLLPDGAAQELVVTRPGFAAARRTVAGGAAIADIVLAPETVRQSVTVTEAVEPFAVEGDAASTRMNIPLINLPQAVSVVTSAVLREQAVVTPADALRNVAGVRNAGTYSGTYERLTLRGFTQSQVATYFRNGARFVMLATPNVAAVEQIEVIKGPASVLYGNVVPGGVINIVPKRPRETRHYEFSYRPGSYNSHEGFADLTGPLWERAGLYYRLNLYGRRADSFRDLVYNDGYLLNPSVQWRPATGTSLTLDMEMDRLWMRTDPGLVAPDGRTLDSARSLSRSLFLGHRDATFQSLRRFFSADLSQQLPQGWLLRATYNYTPFNRSPNLVYGSSLSADGRAVNQTVYPFVQDYFYYFGQADLLGSVRTGPATHTILIGGDTLNWRGHYTSGTAGFVAPVLLAAPDPARPASFTAFGRTNIRSLQRGGYVQDQIAFRNGLSFLVGARYTTYEDFAARQRDVNTSPRVAALYRPLPWLSVYGSYSESFEPIAGLDFLNATFRPSLGKQTEAGVKSRLFGDRLLATFAWFHLRRTNVLTADPANPAFSVQTGEQRSRGIEVEATGSVTRQWQLIGAYAHTDAEITRDNRFAIGSRLPTAPRHSGSVWSSHSFAGRLRPLGAGVGVFYTGGTYESALNRYRIPGYATVDAAASWRLRERYKLQLNVKNLFDRTYYYTATNLFSIFPGAPRTVTGGVTATF